jgi:hypothetical protein
MVINRYLSAILSTAIVILTAFVAIPQDAFTLGDPQVAAFVALAASTVISYLVPLVPGKWPGALKTGVGILAALFAAVWPLLSGSSVDWTLVVLAGLNALAQEFGVKVRVDDPTLNRTPVEAGTIKAAGSGSVSDPAVITTAAAPVAPEALLRSTLAAAQPVSESAAEDRPAQV